MLRYSASFSSEAQGHENPVYMGSPQPPSRTVAQILTRQTSETGRHLLSDPGTPFSPNPQGDVFFPAHGKSQDIHAPLEMFFFTQLDYLPAKIMLSSHLNKHGGKNKINHSTPPSFYERQSKHLLHISLLCLDVFISAQGQSPHTHTFLCTQCKHVC